MIIICCLPLSHYTLLAIDILIWRSVASRKRSWPSGLASNKAGAISYSSPKGTLPFYTTRGHKPNRIPLQKAQIAITIIGELMRGSPDESSVAVLASRGPTFDEQVWDDGTFFVRGLFKRVGPRLVRNRHLNGIRFKWKRSYHRFCIWNLSFRFGTHLAPNVVSRIASSWTSEYWANMWWHLSPRLGLLMVSYGIWQMTCK
jgi:hypothetical protein